LAFVLDRALDGLFSRARIAPAKFDVQKARLAPDGILHFGRGCRFRTRSSKNMSPAKAGVEAGFPEKIAH
jgi:hypothetical protein